jgi:hypothetical protein
VSDERPGDVAVNELRDGDLASEGTVRAVEDVLCGDLNGRCEVFAGQEKVDRGRCNDDFCIGIWGGVSSVSCQEDGTGMSLRW